MGVRMILGITVRIQIGTGVRLTSEYAVILVGDFNVPARGYIYGALSDAFNDTFVDGGRGFGFTFPGETRNPLTFNQPWLRIDHAFTSGGLSTNYAEVEKGRSSQHRGLAVSCRFQ